jgi:hypothetical protein
MQLTEALIEFFSDADALLVVSYCASAIALAMKITFQA